MLESNIIKEEANTNEMLKTFDDIKSDFKQFVTYMRVNDPVLVVEKNKFFQEYFYILGAWKSLVVITTIYLIFAVVFCYYCFQQYDTYTM